MSNLNGFAVGRVVVFCLFSLFSSLLWGQSSSSSSECFEDFKNQGKVNLAISPAEYEECIRACLYDGDTLCAATLLRLSGEGLLNAGQLDSANNYFNLSLQLYEALNDDWHSADVLNGLSRVYLYKGEFEEARVQLEEALDLAEQPKYRDSIHPFYMFMGQVMFTLRDYGQADIYFGRALEMYKKGNKPVLERTCLYGWAVSCLPAGEVERADSLIQQANQIEVPESENFRMLIMKTRAEARLYNSRSQFEETIRTYGSLRDVADSIQNFGVKVEVAIGMANAHVALGRYDEAKKLYQEIIDDTLLYDNPFMIDGLFRRYATFLDEIGEYQESGVIKSRLIVHNDSMYTKAQLESFRASHLTDLQDKTFKLLDENVEKGKLIEYYEEYDALLRNLIIISIVFIIILTILSIRLWRARRLSLQRKQKLLESNEKLAEIDRQRIELVKIVGHDLRGPIWALRNFVELLNAGKLRDEDVTSMRAHAFNSLIEVQDLLEDLTDWAESSAGLLVTEDEHIELRALIDSMLGTYRLHAIAKDVEIKLLIPESVDVICDRRALSTILRNLIENAIKHTTKGVVTIGGSLEDGKFTVRIDDTGEGMNEETLLAIRNKSKVDSIKGTAGEGGKGLGMRTVFLLCAAVGLDLAIKSEVGKGTSVCLQNLVTSETQDLTHQSN